MTVKDILSMDYEKLGNIELRARDIGTIGKTIIDVANDLKACIDAMEQAEQEAARKEAENAENVVPMEAAEDGTEEK